MKLEVGQFARLKSGYICKIINVNDFREPNMKYGVEANYLKDVMFIGDDDVVKASYNIIDILEVGDYVNGYKVEKVNNNLSEHKGICNSLDTYLWGINDLDEFEKIVIFENDIKSVVTKEEFESMKYRIEGEQDE